MKRTVRTATKIIDGQVYEFQLIDLWSRPGIWSRQRAYIFLTTNFLVYAALSVFIFWIHQAKFFDFSWQSYTATYYKTLIDRLFFPLSIQEAPVMIPILGMLMATIIVVPILIAQLYGFRYSVLFALCTLVLAHLPVLSLFLVASSFIAGVGKYRLPFKFGVALLSLFPIGVYFIVATRGASMVQFKPIDPAILYAPWVLAGIAAAVISAIVLGFARMVKYRPGGLIVGMTPFIATPLILFHHFIGADQLEFRLLAHRLDPSSPVFAPVDISSRVFQETLKNWRRYKVRDLQAIVDQARYEFPFIAQQLNQEDRDRILRACDAFLRRHPESRFVPNALYIRALALDMRFDYQVLMKKWTVEYTTDAVCPLSRSTWRRLVDEYAGSVYAEPARFRLAMLDLRDGRVDAAKTLLRDLLAVDRSVHRGASTQPSDLPISFRELFTAPRSTAVPSINTGALVEQAQELLEMIEFNADDPRYGSKPLAELMCLDPHHPQYRDHLLELAGKYMDSRIHDNLLVRFALTDPDPEQRKATLERFSKRVMDPDAGAKVLYELAGLLQAWGLVNMDSKAHAQAEHYYHLLIRKYPQSIFATRARSNLRQLEGISGQFYTASGN